MSAFTIDSIYEMPGRLTAVTDDETGIDQVICQGSVANGSTWPS